MFRSMIALLFAALLLMLSAPVGAQQDGQIFANSDFRKAGTDGVPTGWDRRTATSGYVKTHAQADPSYVEIGVEAEGEDSFIQQVAKLPEGAKQVKLTVKYRWSDIEPGKQGHQRGKIQGRFTKAGKDTGAWIDMGNLTGSNAEWVESTRTVNVPAEVDGIMLRLGMYGVLAGKVEVASATGQIITAEALAAVREQYRPKEPYGPQVSDARFGRIMRGININGWFCQPWNQSVKGKKGGFNAEFFQSYITDDDIKMIMAMGFDHIRLPVDPQFLINNETGQLVTELLPELDRAIALIRGNGLAVIIDIHPKNNSFKGLSGKQVLREAFVKWWGEFASHMAKTTDPEHVFLELLNEPGGQTYWANATWEAYQDQLITVVRAAAPEHTIIANGGAYQLVKELGRVKPHPDRNVIWAVHYYEPSPFTHQGARWMKDWYHPLNEVPWPLTAENVEETIAKLKDMPAKANSIEVLHDQVKSGYATRAFMEAQIAQVAAWSRENNIRVHIGEYGVVDNAPRDSRVRYLREINEVFDAQGIARSMWNYSGSNYSVVTGKDEPGMRSPDEELVEAMGLRKQSSPAKHAD